MSVQFAILDDQGQVFGMRQETYVSMEAAQSALDFLMERRKAMQQEAHRAYLELSTHTGWDNETASREASLREAVARWDNEKDRNYRIARREVTPWVPMV